MVGQSRSEKGNALVKSGLLEAGALMTVWPNIFTYVKQG